MNNIILKNKNFILLIIGSFISKIGTELQTFALSIYVMELTGSTKMFGLILSLSIIPKIICTPLFMSFIDKVNPKKILYLVDIFNGVFLLLVFYYTKFYNLNIAVIVVINIILAITSTLFNPTSTTFVPSILEEEDLVKGNSIQAINTSITQVMGPLLGVCLIKIIGIKLIIFINAISFIISSILTGLIKYNHEVNSNSDMKISLKDSTKELINYFNKEIFFKTTLILAIFLNFIVNPIISLGTIHIVKRSLNLNNFYYSLFEAMIVISTLIGNAISIKVSKRYSFKGILRSLIYSTIMSFIIISVILNIGGAISSIVKLIPIVTCFMIIISIISIFNVVLISVLQSKTDMRILGRVNMSMQIFSMSAIPLGQIFFGYLFDNINTGIVFIIASILFYIPYRLFNINKNLSQVESI